VNVTSTTAELRRLVDAQPLGLPVQRHRRHQSTQDLVLASVEDEVGSGGRVLQAPPRVGGRVEVLQGRFQQVT
jgi:hypothetical protein